MQNGAKCRNGASSHGNSGDKLSQFKFARWHVGAESFLKYHLYVCLDFTIVLTSKYLDPDDFNDYIQIIKKFILKPIPLL